MFGLPSLSHVRPDKPQPTPNASIIHSDRSIHKVLTEGTAAQVKRLLEQGANIEARDAQGATPLITAAGRGNLALVTLLLNRHAEVETTDGAGNTALHQASFYGQMPCVEALLATGAQTSARNALAFTPPHQAVRRFWELSGESRSDRLTRQANVIDILLRHGADPELRDASGRTPITLATESSNGSLRHAFNRTPLRAIPAAEIPTRPQSPTPTAESSQALPAWRLRIWGNHQARSRVTLRRRLEARPRLRPYCRSIRRQTCRHRTTGNRISQSSPSHPLQRRNPPPVRPLRNPSLPAPEGA